MQRSLSASEVCRILGDARGENFSMQTLHNWCASGVLTPVHPGGGGTGNHRVFSIVDILSVAIGRGLRSTGEYTMEAAGSVMRAIQAYSEERLLSDFAAGKTCLVFLGGYAYPQLLNEDEAREAAEEFVAEHPEMYRMSGLRPQGIDVKQVYLNIIRVIGNQEKSKATV